MAKYARSSEYAAPLSRVSFLGCRGSVVVTQVVNSSYCAAETRKTPRRNDSGGGGGGGGEGGSSSSSSSSEEEESRKRKVRGLAIYQERRGSLNEVLWRLLCLLALKVEFSLCHPLGQASSSASDSSTGGVFVEYRQFTMETAKRQDLVIPWRTAAGATVCPFLPRRKPIVAA